MGTIGMNTYICVCVNCTSLDIYLYVSIKTTEHLPLQKLSKLKEGIWKTIKDKRYKIFR